MNVMKQKLDIKALRQERGWNQFDLAIRLGVDQTTVSRWENDKPMNETARKLFERVIQENPPVSRKRPSKRKSPTESVSHLADAQP